MTIQEIITRARRLTYTNSVQYSDEQAMQDFNIIYRQLCNSIMQELNEGFFWDTFEAGLNENQSEYVLPEGLKKIEDVYVDYNDDGNYTKAIGTTISSLPRDYEHYRQNQSPSRPMYEINDNSIFIFPMPKESVGGIKLKGTILPSELNIAAEEEDILLPEEFHHIISDGMKQYMFTARGKINEKNDSINEYNMSKSEMLHILQDRQSTPTIGLLPNLTYYA